MKRVQFFFVIILILFSPLISAQKINHANNSDDIFNVIGNDFTAFYKTGANVFTAPLSFKEKDWLITGSIVSATSLSFLIDKKERSFWERNKSKTMYNISSTGHFYGSIENAAILSGLLYVSGLVSKNNFIRKTGRNLGEALFYAGITTLSLKFIFGRSRPFTNDGPYRFNFFQTGFSHTSFPSGDITVAFTVSSVLSDAIDNPYTSIVLYSLAGTTFLQRMYVDDHWLTDSILAAAIGYFIGSSVNKFEEEVITKSNMSFKPYYTPLSMGLSFQLKIN